MPELTFGPTGPAGLLAQVTRFGAELVQAESACVLPSYVPLKLPAVMVTAAGLITKLPAGAAVRLL